MARAPRFPSSMKYGLKRAKLALDRARLALVPVRHRSRASHAFHCCVHKTASQWLRAILSDPRVYRYSGLRPFTYQVAWMRGFDSRKLSERRFEREFPTGAVVTPLYADYEGFRSIPGNDRARAFFVLRDPRDVLVSWYFSIRYSHGVMSDIGERRRRLRELPLEEGLLEMLEYVAEFGLFDALDSWSRHAPEDDRVTLVRFEDLTGPGGADELERVFRHLDVAMPRRTLDRLWSHHSFERLSGRRRGEEDPKAHYRKGLPGDWKNHFDAAVEARFRALTGDLVERLGYED